MNTKDTIKQRALKLFNKRGVLNVTLRDVAEKLEKSYGNITYHYPTKEHVIEELYFDMVEELKSIGAQMMQGDNLFDNILSAPGHTFDLSIKYIFFFKDFVEIKRNYPEIAKKIDKSNAERKKNLKQALVMLQGQKILNALDDEGLDYLMELSGAMRTFFFLNLSKDEFKEEGLKDKYIAYTNKLLIPYLTVWGKQLYEKYN